ncbi:MAG: peptidylprolyl isomerase [Candidatus Micrarchaeia archaeon]
MEKLNDGDFIKITYTGRSAVTGKIFDTTDADKAKEAGIFEESRKYGPVLIVVGKEHVVKGLDAALREMSTGEQKTVELQPADAFGERNPNLVRILPISEFRKREIEPFPGLLLDLDGMRGVVKSVSGGRVMVDLNHPLAGEKVVYEVKVEEKLADFNSKVNGLLDSFALKPESIKFENGVLSITFPPNVKKDADFLINKSSFAGSVHRLLPEVKKLIVVEEYSFEQ